MTCSVPSSSRSTISGGLAVEQHDDALGAGAGGEVLHRRERDGELVGGVRRATIVARLRRDGDWVGRRA